jgi:transmembrane sensor
MNEEPVPPPSDRAIESNAAEWLARRDRGLTSLEQDEFLDWIGSNPRHAATLQKLERTWQALDCLSEWRPENSARPNADLLVVRPRRRSKLRPFSLLALATGLAASLLLVFRPSSEPVSARKTIRVVPAPEVLKLDDSSIVTVDENARIEPIFNAAERRVRLISGEAHFSVAKDPQRPFVVEAGAVIVRAVGTAFNVRHAGDTVDVLVTHGSVELERPIVASSIATLSTPMPLIAGELATVDNAPDGRLRVTSITSAEIEQVLAWRRVRLQFADAPLSEVIAAFNLRNRKQLVIGDPAVAHLRVGGTFRADNVETFVRSLEMGFGVRAEQRGEGEIVLWLRRQEQE